VVGVVSVVVVVDVVGGGVVVLVVDGAGVVVLVGSPAPSESPQAAVTMARARSKIPRRFIFITVPS
jgi:hypothetical protein